MATAAHVQPSAPHQDVLTRHPLTFYFVIAYAGSWLVWLPLALSEDGTWLLPFGIPVLLTTYGYAAFLGPFLIALFPTPLVTDYGTTVPMAIGFGVLALLVIALTRGRLGYERYRRNVLVPATVQGKGADGMIEGWYQLLHLGGTLAR